MPAILFKTVFGSSIKGSSLSFDFETASGIGFETASSFGFETASGFGFDFDSVSVHFLFFAFTFLYSDSDSVHVALSSELSDVYDVLDKEDKSDHFLDFLDLDFSHVLEFPPEFLFSFIVLIYFFILFIHN